LPEGVRHFHYVPFSALLPMAAAFVRHGGIGTTAQALAAGVPQLVVPMAHDQPDNAMRVRRLGVGEFLLPGRYRTATVRARLERLMGSAAARANCRRFARAMVGADTVAHACALVEALADGATAS
jgi:UDP:flavonoid glycosyltransferase YjiC (YdhE family)